MRDITILEKVERDYIQERADKIKIMTLNRDNLDKVGTMIVHQYAKDILDCLTKGEMKA